MLWFRLVRVGIAAILLSVAPACVATGVLVASAEADFPDRGEHVVVDGLRLRYVEAGAGRPIVLIHGAFGGLEDFQATIFDDVAARGRAVAFDRPGHGWSDRPCETLTPDVHARILHDACRQLGVERPVLVGFSFGGAVAAAWASAWPDDVAGLVLLNAPTHPWGGSPDPTYVLALLPFVGEVFTWNLVSPMGALVAGSGASNAFAPEPVPPSFERSPLPLALRPASFRANAEDLRYLDANLTEQVPRYPNVHCPVVFVVGEGDRIVGPEFHSPKWIAEVPGTTRVVVPGVGHQVLFARPAACVLALDAVLLQLASSSD